MFPRAGRPFISRTAISVSHAHTMHAPSLCQVKPASSHGQVHPLASEWVVGTLSTSFLDSCQLLRVVCLPPCPGGHPDRSREADSVNKEERERGRASKGKNNIFHSQNAKRTVNIAGVYSFIPLATSTQALWLILPWKPYRAACFLSVPSL